MNTNVVQLRPDNNDPIPFHELANVLPLLEGERFNGLLTNIKEIGQIDPITVLNGAILDGRNRYRVCLQLGITPRVEELTPGIDPVKFVVGRNMERRDLSLSQRSYAMAQFATYKRGGDTTQDVSNRNSVPNAQPETQPNYTITEAAEIAQSNVKYIQYGKIVMNEGTPEEKEAVRNGSANLRAVAKRIIRARHVEAPPKPIAAAPPGARMIVPDGQIASEWCRKGMLLEQSGKSAEQAAKAIGMSERAYRLVRDIVRLTEHSDLTERDQKIARQALDYLDSTRMLARAYEKVRDIAERLWGAGGLRNGADKRRIEAFVNAIIVIEATCQRGAELEIPYLSREALKETTSQIEDAIGNLRQLKGNLLIRRRHDER